MKKISLLVLLTAITICSFSQVTDVPVKPMLKADYLKKSKNKKITAWVLLGVGAVVDIIGIATYPSGILLTPSEKQQEKTAIGLVAAGTVSMLASIPFFIMAKKNKMKAMSLGINTLQFRKLNNSKLHAVNYPVLTLKIGL